MVCLTNFLCPRGGRRNIDPNFIVQLTVGKIAMTLSMPGQPATQYKFFGYTNNVRSFGWLSPDRLDLNPNQSTCRIFNLCYNGEDQEIDYVPGNVFCLGIDIGDEVNIGDIYLARLDLQISYGHPTSTSPSNDSAYWDPNQHPTLIFTEADVGKQIPFYISFSKPHF